MLPVTLNATDYVASSGDVVESGDALATRIIELLRGHSPVAIRFAATFAVSSSYFNILLRRILESLGSEALAKVSFDFSSPLQKQLFRRSLDAAMRMAVRDSAAAK